MILLSELELLEPQPLSIIAAAHTTAATVNALFFIYFSYLMGRFSGTREYQRGGCGITRMPGIKPL